MPLKAKAEAQGSGDFTSMWAGQAASLGRALPAGEVTRKLAAEAQALLGRGVTTRRPCPSSGGSTTTR